MEWEWNGVSARGLKWRQRLALCIECFDAEGKIASSRTTHELDIFKVLENKQNDNHVSLEGIWFVSETNGLF